MAACRAGQNYQTKPFRPLPLANSRPCTRAATVAGLSGFGPCSSSGSPEIVLRAPLLLLLIVELLLFALPEGGGVPRP